MRRREFFKRLVALAVAPLAIPFAWAKRGVYYVRSAGSREFPQWKNYTYQYGEVDKERLRRKLERLVAESRLSGRFRPPLEKK